MIINTFCIYIYQSIRVIEHVQFCRKPINMFEVDYKQFILPMFKFKKYIQHIKNTYINVNHIL